MQRHRFTRWLPPVLLAGTLLMASLQSCGATTAGREIVFSASVAGGTSENTPTSAAFTTYAGWSVVLSKALVAVGPLYFYEGAPQAGLLKRLFAVRSAYACPSHAQYNKGTVLGEVLQQYVVDLLGVPTDMGALVGIAGTCRTVELHLHPPGEIPTGPSPNDIDLLEGHSIRLEGTAAKDGITIPFIAKVTPPDEGLMRVVESIAADVVLDDDSRQPGALRIEPLVDMWLASVEFDNLTDMEGTSYLFTEGTQASTALMRGVRSRQSYRVSWRAQ